MRHLLILLTLTAFLGGSFGSSARADILATGFFSGTIERFNEQSLAQSTFASIASADDPFPGLAGIAVDATNNRILAAARVSNRIYELDLAGNVTGFQQLANGSQPAGMTVDSAGNVYVASNGGNVVTAYDINWNVVNTIVLPDVGIGDNLPNGLAFDSQGRLLISTFAGAGVFRYDPNGGTIAPIFGNPFANGQVGVDANDNVYIGGAAFSSDVLKLDSSDNEIGSPFLTIDETILPQPGAPYSSPDFTSPSGITFDSDGNLIVAALGRTNPTDPNDGFQENGGLFRFSTDGVLLDTFAVNSTPFSAAAQFSFTAIPEPGSLVFLAGGLAAGMLVRRRKR